MVNLGIQFPGIIGEVNFSRFAHSSVEEEYSE